MKIKQHNLELLFKICFVIYTMLSVCNYTYGKTIISVVMWPMFLLGTILVLWRVLHIKDYLKMPGVFLLIGLSISFVFSMLTNYQYGIKDNIVTFVLWIFYFFMLYTRNNDDTSNGTKKEFELISIVYMIYLCVGNFLSILMMVIGYSHVYTNEKGYEVAAGFIWGRLWGIYIDPNFAAVMSTVAICLALYFGKRCKSKVIHILLTITIVVNICFIAFTDSRTGRVCLSVLVIMYGLLWFFYMKKNISVSKKILSIFLIFAVGVGAFYLPRTITNGYNLMWDVISNYAQGNENPDVNVPTGENTSVDEDAPIDENTQIEENTPVGENTNVGADKKIDRGYDIENDISNRRFDIWKSGIEILETSPLLGVSFGGIRQYAEANLPETYIVNNDYKDFSTLDNEVLNVFVGQGLLGGFILIAFVALVLIIVFKNILNLNRDEFSIASTCFVIVTCITASAMFRATMFYHNSPNANVFWSFLGVLVFMLKKSERENRDGAKN